MELENLVKLIQTVSDSDLTGFQYEENGVKLKIQKEKEQMVVSTGTAQLTTVQNVPGAQSNAVSALKSEDGPEKGKEAEGQLIKSPLVGTFYAAPSEEAAPFVAVGDHVSKGQTVAIVEAMKLHYDLYPSHFHTRSDRLFRIILVLSLSFHIYSIFYWKERNDLPLPFSFLSMPVYSLTFP